MIMYFNKNIISNKRKVKAKVNNKISQTTKKLQTPD